ncbi:putative rhamnogalacturonate lyase C [Fulvia fulva]|uniref:Rhamnogalacturonate lyase C n=1 Tax=Passalora fulva TaxID=5499 RepID=A0A9Q8P375_PASFU|nr:putative rhamnogalacturonate lyase C [Fulvia fulva]KAK4636632.1 putative rhamnogalacturonate lyase C [Fulvia fulva]UJO11638.1 putative rhamnogalacturonate lyase C [Fulvia fulva]
MEEPIKTRILIISDTHGAPLVKEHGRKDPFAPFEKPLPKADVLIHCGDMTTTGGITQYHDTLDMLKQIDATAKFVTAGNHDLSLDKDYTLSHAQSEDMTYEEATALTTRAHDLWISPTGRAKREGVTYLEEGVHVHSLPNGATMSICASPYTPEFCDWGFPYDRDDDRFNGEGTKLSDAATVTSQPIPAPSETPIDVFVTHGPPYGRRDRTQDGMLVGCPHLLRAAMRARPMLHCFGHIHEGWGAERVSWSPSADTVTKSPCTIRQWTKEAAWKAGVANNGEGISKIKTDRDEAEQDHAVFVDASRTGKPIQRGTETLMVNASIMNVRYRPINAPWVIDIDLPRAKAA